MSYAFALLFPLIGVGLCVFAARRWSTPDDSSHVLTSDSLEDQVAKMPTSRYRYVRKDGIWHRHRAVSHGSLTLKVEEPVRRT